MAEAEAAACLDPDVLFERFRGHGDPAALAALFDATAPGLYRLALTLAPDPPTAEDAVQEAFLAAMEFADRHDGARPVVPWLVGILRHKVEHLRRRERRRPDPWRLPVPTEDRDPPVSEAERREEEARVHAALEGLPESLRVVALLRWKHGLEPTEIAHLLRERPGSVRMSLSRALARLRRALGGLPAFLFAGEREARGLDGVRRSVVSKAGTAVAIGGILMAKKAIAVAAVLLLLLGAGAVWRLGPWESRPVNSIAVVPVPPRSPVPPKPATTSGEAGTATAAVVDDPAESPPAGDAKQFPAEDPAALPPDYAGYNGRVVDGDLKPVEGARVRLTLPGGDVMESRTDATGAFQIKPPRTRSRGSLAMNLIATDERGRVARATARVAIFTADPEVLLVFGSLFLQDMILRPASSPKVIVLAGGVPVAGALVRAEDEEGTRALGEEVLTDVEGKAVLDAIPDGSWTVLARAPGHGRGKGRLRLPATGDGPLVVTISSRTVDVEVVAAGTGKPVEGARIEVREEQFGPTGSVFTSWVDAPLQVQPTDSSGHARIEGVGADERLEVLPIPPGEPYPVEGTLPVAVEPGATSVRLEVAGRRKVRWPIKAGTRPVPADGTRIEILESNMLRFRDMGLGKAIEGRVEGGVLRAEGFGGRALNLVGIAPDGSLARLRAVEGSEKGEPASFAEARTLVVVVKGEDGAPVDDAAIVIKDDSGEPLTSLELPNAEGKFSFSGLPSGVVVVCPLAHWDYGGAEAARLELKEETTRVEVVVGNVMQVGVRIRVAGKPRLPERMDLHLKYPGPGPLDGLLNFEPLLEEKEDPERGEVRFTARPHAPGKPLVLELTVPGSEPRRAEVKPPAVGGVAWAEFDL